MKKIILTLLRHGLSTANFEGIAQGQMDFPLHPIGVNQAESLAKYWLRTNQSFDMIITSPLQRAKETASILGASLSVAITEDPLWMERNFGVGEGLTYDQIEKRFSDNQFQWSNYEPVFEQSETEYELSKRAALGLQSITEGASEAVLVVSHGGILNAALRMLLEIPLSREGIRPPGFRFDNTGFSVLSYEMQSARWQILCHNARPHLEQDQ